MDRKSVKNSKTGFVITYLQNFTVLKLYKINVGIYLYAFQFQLLNLFRYSDYPLRGYRTFLKKT